MCYDEVTTPAYIRGVDGREKSLISVVIPTYNRKELLVRAVNSVLNQTWKDLEVLVVDDASTDGTEACLREQVTDPRVRYLRQERQQGACAARNRGVEEARGEWIAFQDSDDTWQTEKLAEQMAQLKESGADIVFCAFARHAFGTETPHVFPHEHVPEGRVRYEDLLFENLISTQTMLGKRDCFRAEPFDVRFPRLQDWELVLRLARRYDIRYYRRVLVDVYEQADSISRKPEKAVQALRMLYRMHREGVNGSERTTDQMLFAIRSACSQCGMEGSVWRDYFHALTPRRSCRENAKYLVKGLLALSFKG